MNRTNLDAPACPGTLKEGYTTYNPSTIKNLFDGKKVFHVLEDNFSKEDWALSRIQGNHYGGQLWHRMKLQKNRLIPCPAGDYLLKTIGKDSSEILFPLDQPANEHLSLQMASTIFKIETIPNALMFFEDGHPAFLSKIPLAAENKFSEWTMSINADVQNGARAKKNYSYLSLAELIDRNVSANIICKENYFRNIIYLWLIGDTQNLINKFLFIKTSHGDWVASPLYNTMSICLHELTGELGAPGGLYPNDRNTPEFLENGHYTVNEFTSLGKRMGIKPMRIDKIISSYKLNKTAASSLINKAFLPEAAKQRYRFHFMEKINRL